MYSRLNNGINQTSAMAGLNFHKQKIAYLALGLIVFILFLWINSQAPETIVPEINNPKFSNVQSFIKNNANSGKIDEIDTYSKALYKTLKQYWILPNCLQTNSINDMSLEYLPDYIEKFTKSTIKDCNYLGKVFLSMFELDMTYSDVRLSPEFSQRVLKWLDNNEGYLNQATHQKIIKLYNKYTNEEAIFNPLRGKRPIKKPEVSDKKFSFDMIADSQKTCDFCNNYTKNTAEDVFQRIETNLSYSAANTFKYDKWHGLILARSHNPLTLMKDEFIDMFDLALTWYKAVKKQDKDAKYPALLWDVMPKSGASQVHPHFQTSFGVNNYYGGMRRWLEASKRYYQDNKRNFFDDFILIHSALGLTFQYRSAYLIANLIPIKEQEVMLISENSKKGYDDLVVLLHETIKIMVNELELYSWSLGMFMPVYTSGDSFFTEQTSNENEGNLDRIFCRIVFRFPAAALRSDYNGLDMYTSSVLGIDRYQVANKLFSKLDTVRHE